MAAPVVTPRRSAIYMPASNARALDKGRTLDADCLIFDLEDAVAPEVKADARVQAIAAAASGAYGHREIIVRGNALETMWGADDAAAVAALPGGTLLAPKVNRPEDIAAIRAGLGAQANLWLMIETPQAILALRDIAAASREHDVAAWVIGTNDLAKDLRATLDAERSALMTSVQLAIVAARSCGVAILDGVFNDLEDATAFEAQCRQGVALGFDGKTLIHPSQIEACNRIFAPSADAIAEAEAIVAAFALPENASKGVIRAAGRMVERLHLEQARQTLTLAAAIGARA